MSTVNVDAQLYDRVGLTDIKVGDTFEACAPEAKRRIYRTYRAVTVIAGQVLGVNVKTGKERSFTPKQLSEARRYPTE